MKSIKKMSHEIGWVYSKHYDPTACKQEWCEMAAREGANYVLECLERAIELNESTFVYCREKYIKVQVLNELIEKLKCNNYGKKRGNRGH